MQTYLIQNEVKQPRRKTHHKVQLQRKTRAYVRVSTKQHSQKDSPENQEALIREEVAAENDYVEKVYVDKATATSIMDREDVKQMIDDAKNGEFDTIYFASLSRFSRDTLDAIALKRTLVNALGIRVVSIEDLYDSGVEDNEMIFTIISSVNQKQSENTSKSAKRGKRQSAARGNFTGNIAPYGYKRVTKEGRKTLEIVPEKAAVVRTIYDLYINKGMGEKMICLYLNDEGIKSPKGGLWGVTTVQVILQNEHYTGHLVFSKYGVEEVYDDIDDMHNRRKKLVMREKSEWEKSQEQTHEAIISTEQFEEAQRIRFERGGGKRGGLKRYVNIFAKFIFCKECGSAMVVAGTSKKLAKTKEVKEYRYLLCSKHRRQGEKGCKNLYWFDYNELKDKIVKDIMKITTEHLKLYTASKAYSERTVLSVTSYDKQVKELNKKLSDTRMLLFEIRKLLLTNQITREQYEFEKEQYELEINNYSADLAVLEKKNSRVNNMDEVVKEIENSLSYLTNNNDNYSPMEMRNYLMKVIDKIEVDTEGTIYVHSVLSFD